MTLVTTPKKRGRKTNAARLQTKHDDEILARRLAAERETQARELEEAAKQAKPMRANTVGFRRVVVAGTGLVAIAAFAISFGAIYELSAWTGWDQWQLILAPLLFDAGIVVFNFLSFIRMDKSESAVPTFLLAEVLTLLSSVAQVIHTLFTADVVGLQLLVACVIAALPPLVLSACSYLLGRTLFKRRPVATP